MKRVSSIIFICLALASSLTHAADPSASAISNIGFMKDPPKGLKDKFPMCDAFLKVKWYDEENSIGYSEYEFYNKGKKSNRVAHAMIYLDEDRPEFMIDLERFRKDLEREHKKGDLKTIFEMIGQGNFNRQGQGDVLTLVIDKGNGKLFIYEFSDISDLWYAFTDPG